MAIRADRVGVREDQVDVHGRVTSPSFLNELLESLPEWTDMPVWVNGTEELLPSNNSVPVTSPILADIAYPDIRRDNQYFTYRESPTPVDGLAKIKSIKGNTLVWNQLLQSLAPTTTRSGVTFTKNNDGTWTLNGTATSNVDFRFDQTNTVIANPRTYYANHKYLLKVNKVDGVRLGIMQQSTWAEPLSTSRNTGAYDIQTLSQTYENCFAYFFVTSGTSFANVVLKPQLFDLTQMGLDISSPSEFTSLFSLPYYAYNQGTLLSFMGNGIKTVGKNLLPFDLANIKALNTSGTWNDNVYSLNQLTFKVNDDGTIIVNGTSTAVTVLDLIFQGANNFVGCKFNGSSQTTEQQSIAMQFLDENNVYQTALTQNNNNSLTIPNYPKCTLRIRIGNAQTLNNVVFKPMIRNANVVDDTYQPYTTNTLSLPISTYFPTGMKRAGNVYDELTPTKAITRIGAVDLGTLNWIDIDTNVLQTNSLASLIKPSSVSSLLTPFHSAVEWSNLASSTKAISVNANGIIRVKDTSFISASAFKTAMSGVYLYYELATPVELPTMSFE